MLVIHKAIRAAGGHDAEAIASIYEHYVLHSTANFEEVPPTADEITSRMTALLERGYPWLVLEVQDRVVGYAFAGPYKERSAYRYTVEDSIYVCNDHRRAGIGRALLSALINDCSQRGFRHMMAVIGDSCNIASVKLHTQLGFRRIGLAENIGFKHGRSLDVVYMQRVLENDQA